jgi:hypothetical protein
LTTLTPKQAFQTSGAHPGTLAYLLARDFGDECFGWEPETLWVEVYRTYNTRVSREAKNKVQAVKTIFTSNQPMTQWHIFENVCHAAEGLAPRFDMIQPLSPKQCVRVLRLFGLLRRNVRVSEEVYRYCAACLFNEGVVYGPGLLKPCNRYLVGLLSQSAGDVALHDQVGDIHNEPVSQLPSSKTKLGLHVETVRRLLQEERSYERRLRSQLQSLQGKVLQ